MSNLSKVNVGVLDRDKSEFDLSFTNNTTNDFGHVQTLACEYIPLGDTSIDFQVKNFTRVSPLVAPTFGFFRNHNFYHYVKCSDVYPYFSNVLAGIPVYMSNEESVYDAGGVVIENLPHIQNFHLSLLLLNKMNVKMFFPRYVQQNAALKTYDGYYQVSRSLYENIRQSIFNQIFGVGEISNKIQSDFIDSFSGSYIEYDPDIDNGITEVIDNSLTPFNCQYAFSFKANVPVFDTNGNVVNGVTERDQICYLCFYHTRQSHTLLKHFIGCGYKFNGDYNDTYEVSLLPLMCVGKAYFDIFHLSQYDNYLTSIFYKMYEYYSHNVPDYSADAECLLIEQLFDYLAETVYTDDMDYLSAHQPLESGSQSYDSHLPASPLYGDVSRFKYLNQPEGTSLSQRDASIQAIDLQPAIDVSSRNGWLTHLDIELLQKMYLWINRQTQCGYDIRNILVSRGYSQFVENADSQFLGHDSNDLSVDSVTSLADTFDAETQSGATLGEYSGQSAGRGDGKNISFKANEIGYFICLNVVTPNTGYVGALKPSVLGINKWSLYNPEFDGFGYEWSPSAIVGRCDQFYRTESGYTRVENDTQAFGLIPRMSGYKKHSDVANGDMLNFMFRDNFAPYYMERLFTYNRVNGSERNDGRFDIWQPGINIAIPPAGEIWRKTVTNKFMGNYNRVFQNFNYQPAKVWLNLPIEDEFIPQDNFISHNVIIFKIWSRMLPIMDTFQTEEAAGEGKHITVTK